MNILNHLMKILKAFRFAFNGIKICFASETNFKIHAAAATVAVSLGFVLNISGLEWLAIVCSIAFVAALEMVNTAIEKLCDVVHKDFHAGIKKVKDIAAGAVLLAAVSSLVTGSIVFLPKIIILIKSI
jgi:diacylglycerol kinase